MYFVPLGEIFMYRRDGSDFQAIAPYTFVKPIEKEDKMVGGFIISASESNSHKGMVKLQGIMAYPNQDLINQGVKAGDRIAFSPYSEYEFNLNGEIYYKMSTKDILAVL
jgi:co-chaperonin GroES (HSP10)